MVPKERIDSIIDGYSGKDLTVATACSHTSLQIFDGARKEGFKTLGITIGQNTKFYEAFPRGRPDEFFKVDTYPELLDRADELVERNVILVPHGSFVEYMTPRNFEALAVPTSATGAS